MATAKKKSASKQTAPESTSDSDAIELLTSDHAEVKELFEAYEDLVDDDAEDDEKLTLAHKICMMLTVHATIEEEIFYPAAKELLDEPDLVNEATVEHASAKELIAQIEESDPSDELFDSKVKVLAEYIEHHVREEEDEMFPAVQDAGMDTASVGEELSLRKEELMAEMSEDDEADEE